MNLLRMAGGPLKILGGASILSALLGGLRDGYRSVAPSVAQLPQGQQGRFLTSSSEIATAQAAYNRQLLNNMLLSSLGVKGLPAPMTVQQILDQKRLQAGELGRREQALKEYDVASAAIPTALASAAAVAASQDDVLEEAIRSILTRPTDSQMAPVVTAGTPV